MWLNDRVADELYDLDKPSRDRALGIIEATVSNAIASFLSAGGEL